MSDERDPLRIDDPLSRRLVIGLVLGGVLTTLVLVLIVSRLLAASP